MGNSSKHKLKEPVGLPWDFGKEIPVGVDFPSIQNNPKIFSFSQETIAKYTFWLNAIGIVVDNTRLRQLIAIFITHKIDSYPTMIYRYRLLISTGTVHCLDDIIAHFIILGIPTDVSTKMASYLKNTVPVTPVRNVNNSSMVPSNKRSSLSRAINEHSPLLPTCLPIYEIKCKHSHSSHFKPIESVPTDKIITKAIRKFTPTSEQIVIFNESQFTLLIVISTQTYTPGGSGKANYSARTSTTTQTVDESSVNNKHSLAPLALPLVIDITVYQVYLTIGRRRGDNKCEVYIRNYCLNGGDTYTVRENVFTDCLNVVDSI